MEWVLPQWTGVHAVIYEVPIVGVINIDVVGFVPRRRPRGELQAGSRIAYKLPTAPPKGEKKMNEIKKKLEVELNRMVERMRHLGGTAASVDRNGPEDG